MDYGESKCEVFQADEKTNLLARIWLPEKEIKAIFIGVHGGMAHGGDWTTSAQYFKQNDVATYALDMRWHGTYPEHNKGGKTFFHIDSYDEYSKDIQSFYNWIKERHPHTPIFIISHSNGALISLYHGLSLAEETDIRGYIVSSPWLENKVPVPKMVKYLSKIIASIYPKFAVALESVTNHLTHDENITARHFSDEKKGLRGTRVSVKLGVESEKTQKFVLENMKNWNKFPIFCVIAGQDMLAVPETSERAMAEVQVNLVKMIIHDENYHENFNELNRDETFGQIWDWAQKYI